MATRNDTMTQASRLRIGVLGAGRRGNEQIRSILALPDLYELVAICDLTPGVAASAAALAGAHAHASPREFLARENPDVVVITTPRETHHLMVKLVAEHGSNMLIETPLATTRAMMDVIEEATTRGKMKVEVGEQMWRRPAEPLNRQAIAAGLIGQVLRVTSFYGPAGGNSCYHTMSLMRSYAGADAEEIQGITYPHSAGGVEGETWTQGFMKYANGVTGSITFTSNWAGPLRRGHPRFFSVEGTEGFIITGDGPGHMLRRVEHGTSRDYPKQIETNRAGDREDLVRMYYETEPVIEFRNPFTGCIAQDQDVRSANRIYDELARASELQSIHRAVTTDAAPDYGVAQARRDMELSILLAESAHRRMPLRASADELGPETEWERREHESFRQTYGADPIKDMEKLIANML